MNKTYEQIKEIQTWEKTMFGKSTLIEKFALGLVTFTALWAITIISIAIYQLLN